MSFTPLHCHRVLGSTVVSIHACHEGDRGSILRRGEFFFFISKIRTEARYSALRSLSRLKAV